VRDGKVKASATNATETITLGLRKTPSERSERPALNMEMRSSEVKIDAGHVAKGKQELTEDAVEDGAEGESSDDSVRMNEFLKDVELINDGSLETAEDDGIL